MWFRRRLLCPPYGFRAIAPGRGGMKLPSLLVSVLLVLVTPATSQTQLKEGPEKTPVFRSSVDLVPLSVTVTDARGRYITDLGKDDFAVFEDGVRQGLTVFATEGVPLDLAILLDISGSMAREMALVQDAAIRLIRTLREGDRGSVVVFNEVVRVPADFTTDIGELQAAIRATAAYGNTSLYEAIYITLRTFERARPDSSGIRRPAMVVLSDGLNTAGLVSFDDVLELAKRTGVSIYTISLNLDGNRDTRVRQSVSQSLVKADYALRALARDSGGRSFFPAKGEELGDVYATIGEELAYQYLLGYTPTNQRRDGAFRRVSVRVATRSDVRLRTRSGYFAERTTDPR